MIADVKCSCGRFYLEVAGIAVAMQGDNCRASLPEECLDPIPSEELEAASIGGKPAKDLPIEHVRFFRGERWTKESLEYVAGVINDAAAPEASTHSPQNLT